MFDDKIENLLSLILHRLESDEYEMGRFLTVGGPTGNYVLRSPYNTECEWIPMCAATNGTGIIAATANNSGLTIPSFTGTVGYGLVSNGEDNNALDMIVASISNGVPQTFLDIWQPLPSPGNVYVAVSASGGASVFLTCAFRRKLDRYIPDQPRGKSMHQHVPSRRNQRTMPRGFEEQYPQPGEKYAHQGPGPVDRYNKGGRRHGG